MPASPKQAYVSYFFFSSIFNDNLWDILVLKDKLGFVFNLMLNSGSMFISYIILDKLF
jgi:hypothetical protein